MARPSFIVRSIALILIITGISVFLAAFFMSDSTEKREIYDDEGIRAVDPGETYLSTSSYNDYFELNQYIISCGQ